MHCDPGCRWKVGWVGQWHKMLQEQDQWSLLMPTAKFSSTPFTVLIKNMLTLKFNLDGWFRFSLPSISFSASAEIFKHKLIKWIKISQSRPWFLIIGWREKPNCSHFHKKRSPNQPVSVNELFIFIMCDNTEHIDWAFCVPIPNQIWGSFSTTIWIYRQVWSANSFCLSKRISRSNYTKVKTKKKQRERKTLS